MNLLIELKNKVEDKDEGKREGQYHFSTQELKVIFKFLVSNNIYKINHQIGAIYKFC